MGNAQIERARKNMSKKTFRCETNNRVTDGGRTDEPKGAGSKGGIRQQGKGKGYT